MSSDEKVLDFPRVEGTSEENAKRVMVEATRLLVPGEWRLWIDRSAERLRIPRAILEDVIAAIIKDSQKKARDAETEARRHELAVRREQERKQREQKRDQERTDKRAEHKRKEREKAFERTLPPFATISQHLWACKAGLHQQIHGMSNSGPIRSRRRSCFRRSALRLGSTSSCALKR